MNDVFTCFPAVDSDSVAIATCYNSLAVVHRLTHTHIHNGEGAGAGEGGHTNTLLSDWAQWPSITLTVVFDISGLADVNFWWRHCVVVITWEMCACIYGFSHQLSAVLAHPRRLDAPRRATLPVIIRGNSMRLPRGWCSDIVRLMYVNKVQIWLSSCVL